MDEREKLLENLDALLNCHERKCEDCKLSVKIPCKPRTCSGMEEEETIKLAIKILKADKESMEDMEKHIESLEYDLAVANNNLAYYVNGNG
jgi:hypothetical protein